MTQALPMVPVVRNRHLFLIDLVLLPAAVLAFVLRLDAREACVPSARWES